MPSGIRNGGSLIRREISGGLEVRRQIGNIGWVVIDGDGSVRISFFFIYLSIVFSFRFEFEKLFVFMLF